MDELKSKSQLKREATALQKMGIKLIELPLEKLNLLPLPDNLKQAIIDAKSITSHGAQRRQAQLIGKLMRNADGEAILEGYQQLQDTASAQSAQFHVIEEWRERLITEGKTALTAFIADYPAVDIQMLRQLVKKAIADQTNERNTGASKALFRYLRSL